MVDDGGDDGGDDGDDGDDDADDCDGGGGDGDNGRAGDGGDADVGVDDDRGTMSRGRYNERRGAPVAKYRELLEGHRCGLIVVGVETGGRFGQEAVDYVDSLAAAKARDSPHILRRSAHLAWRRRWMRMLAVSCARSFAVSLVSGGGDAWSGTDGCVPDLADLFQMT